MNEDLELLGSGVDPIADQFETCANINGLIAAASCLPAFDEPQMLHCCRYEEYLDKQITATDMFYLGDVSLARQLVELGYHGNGEVIRCMRLHGHRVLAL